MNESRPRSTMGPTSPATLIVAALVAAGLTWLAISRFYWDLPRLPMLPGVTIAALAVLEGIAAHSTKARIDRKPGREPVDPLLVARFVVLAKASSLAASIFGGLYGAASLWLLLERGRRSAAADLPTVLIGLGASILLVAAALWLERSCRVPPQQDETDSKPGSTPGDQVG